MGMSGADLEYARLLAAAGLTPATAKGYDGARLEQVSDEFGIDNSLASEIADTGSATNTELKKKYVNEGAAFADIGKQPGVDPTGVTECSAAIQTALDSFLALGVRAYANGTFKIASTVTISYHADFTDATFNYITMGGVAVRVGTLASVGDYVWHIIVKLPRVIAVLKTNPGYAQVAGSVGVDINNLYDSEVSFTQIQNFETGLRLKGMDRGVVYNTIHMGHLDNNKVNLILTANTVGWCNENLFLSGRWSHNSGEGASVAGAYGIKMDVCPNAINNNVFIKPCLEGDTPQFHVTIAGSDNVIYYGRYEVTGGARLKWESDAARNLVDQGVYSGNIVETFAVGATGTNRLKSNFSEKGSPDGGAGGTYINETGDGNNPIYVLMDAGARVAGLDPAVKYKLTMGPVYTKMKAANDTYDRIRFQHDNGRIYMGDNTADATMFLSGWSGSFAAFVVANGHICFAPDNSKDIGAFTQRPRDVFVGRNLEIGGAIDHNGTTLGFYGTPPVTQPAANPDTSGAALAALETEVNQLKALLRSVGLMAP